MITKSEIIKQLKDVGIQKGELLHLKVSMKAIGEIEGGGKTFLDALIETVGYEGTIVCDAFIDTYSLPLSKKESSNIANDKSISNSGYFANLMIQHKDSYRSHHPVHKFCAIGKLAKLLTDNHTAQSGGYDLLDEMCLLGANNLTIGEKTVGVGTTHVAIEKMGFRKKIENQGVNYIDNGVVKLFKVNWNGGCGVGFPKFIDKYRELGSIIKESKIGFANALYTSMQKTLEVELSVLKDNPKFFFCDNPSCYDCRISWEHSEKKYLIFIISWLKANYKEINFLRLVRSLKNRI